MLKKVVVKSKKRLNKFEAFVQKKKRDNSSNGQRYINETIFESAEDKMQLDISIIKLYIAIINRAIEDYSGPYEGWIKEFAAEWLFKGGDKNQENSLSYILDNFKLLHMIEFVREKARKGEKLTIDHRLMS